MERPLDTGYGLILYSRLPLSRTEVEDRVVEGVPSVRTVVTLRTGDHIRLWAVHPEPPVPEEATTGRDSELASAGLSAKDDPLPCIVTGDLNDVAWSSTTRQFQRLSGMADPRVGRGFYNTFDARFPFMRWPLDHLFHDAEFRLVSMSRGDKTGSDHFPMIFTLALAHGVEVNLPDEDVEEIEEADPEEEAEAREMIEEEKKSDREAIGSDWEKDLEGN